MKRSSMLSASCAILRGGVDAYFLAKQMGTSVKMIEDHYGHVTPVKNADPGSGAIQRERSDIVQ
jgi:hypothetical protein